MRRRRLEDDGADVMALESVAYGGTRSVDTVIAQGFSIEISR